MGLYIISHIILSYNAYTAYLLRILDTFNGYERPYVFRKLNKIHCVIYHAIWNNICLFIIALTFHKSCISHLYRCSFGQMGTSTSAGSINLQLSPLSNDPCAYWRNTRKITRNAIYSHLSKTSKHDLGRLTYAESNLHYGLYT